MKTSSAFPSNYLRASDLGGREVSVTISHVNSEPVGRQREMKLIVYFEGKEKGIVLNKTNCKTIEQLAGSDETEDWPGTRVVLFAKEVEFQGDMVEAIRIKAPTVARRQAAPAPPPPPPAREPGDDDDIPF